MVSRLFFFTVLVISFSFNNSVFGQSSTIQLSNPSFEDYARAERVPAGWNDCGFPGESAPDTHPSGAFDVMKYASDGNTYLGLVTRDNDTWERVSQKLSTPLKGGTCYSFSLNLCRSELYVSASRVTGVRANYVDPIKLIIWGGDSHCSKKEQLAESPIIANTEWQPYSFKFEPKQTYTHITLEAFYKTPVFFPYNGNILIDNASPIVSLPCDEEPILAVMPEVLFTNPSGHPKSIKDDRFTLKADVKNITKKSDLSLVINGKNKDNFSFDENTGIVTAETSNLKKGNNRIVLQATNEAGTTSDNAILIYEPEEIVAYQEPPNQPQTYEAPISPKVIPTRPPSENNKIEGYSRSEITKGQIIKISELSFKMNDSKLHPSTHSRLDKIYTFLKQHRDVIIEIGGHTSGLCDDDYCNELSTLRAKEVAKYLENKGIPETQISYKGYGKTRPIASNNTTTGRRKNQRVEIKILSTDG